MPRSAPALALLAGLSFALALGLPAATDAAEDARFMVASTADLAALCAVDPGEPRFAAAIHHCQGYLLGVHHLHEAAIEPSATGGLYCLGDSPPTRDEAAAAFAAWVEATPDAAALPAIEGLIRWAASAYPCP